MARYTTTVTTPKSPVDAWRFMADVRNFPDWDPGIETVRQVAGDGPGPDAAYDIKVSTGGATLRYDVTEFDDPRQYVMVARNRWITSYDRVSVAPAAGGDGADVTYDADLVLNGPLRVFDRLLRLAFHRTGDKASAGLRRTIGQPAPRSTSLRPE